MKVKIVKLMLISMVLGLTSYANEKQKKQTSGIVVQKKSFKKNPYITKKQGVIMDKKTFGEHPIFKLEIEAINTEIAVLINGVEIYRDFSGTQAFMQYPINDYLTSGDNTIDVKLLDDNALKQNAQCKVVLSAYSSDLKETFDLNKIVYNHASKTPLSQSTPSGNYKFEKEFKADTNGALFVDKIVIEPIAMYQNSQAGGIKLQQKFYLTTPFVRWKYLSSEDIIDTKYDNLTEKDCSKLQNTPKIKALYALHEKITQAIKTGNVSLLKKIFKEKSEEKAEAYYFDANNNLNEYIDKLISTANGPDNKIMEYSEKDHYFIIEENRKLAWVRPITIKDNKSGLFYKFKIKCRYQNGEWIVTK